MKNITLLLSFLFLSFNLVKAQTDPCTDITKKYDKEMTVTTYSSPTLQHIYIDRNILDKENEFGPSTYLNFSMTDKKPNYDTKGVYVTFIDGTTWSSGSTNVDCSYLNSNYGYLFSAAKTIHEDVIVLFKTKKIVKVRIGDSQFDIDDAYATKFMAYVKCIDDIKK